MGLACSKALLDYLHLHVSHQLILLQDKMPQDLHNLMAPSIYDIKSHVATVSMEAKSFGVLRLAIGGGSRTVAVVGAVEMIDFMVSQGGAASGKAGPLQARTWWASCSKGRLEKYLEQGNLAMVATVGAGDLLYLPPVLPLRRAGSEPSMLWL